MNLKDKRCVIIGGCGFLGYHIVEFLLEKEAKVVVFDIRKTYDNPKVEFIIGDLLRNEILEKSLQGADVVFHVASPPPELNDRDLFYRVNVEGTKKIIEACKKVGVKRLVLTSSCSVIYEGKDLLNGDETAPYAQTPQDYYVETKILQEKIVLEANDGKDFLTVAIRPHGIFGPKDITVATMVEQIEKGLKFIIGNGKNMVDFTYVKNVVYGHILAAEKLEPGSIACGNIYNITNDEPIGFWEFFRRIAIKIDRKPPSIKLPYFLVYYISVVVSFFIWVLSPIVKLKTTFIPTRISLAATHHYYNCSKAKKELGYKPLLSVDQGLDLTLSSYKKDKKTERKKNK